MKSRLTSQNLLENKQQIFTNNYDFNIYSGWIIHKIWVLYFSRMYIIKMTTWQLQKAFCNNQMNIHYILIVQIVLVLLLKQAIHVNKLTNGSLVSRLSVRCNSLFFLTFKVLFNIAILWHFILLKVMVWYFLHW